MSSNFALAGSVGTLLAGCAGVAAGAAIVFVLAEVQAASAAIGLVRLAGNSRFAIADGAGFSLLAGVSTTPAVAEILVEIGAGGAALAFRRRTGSGPYLSLGTREQRGGEQEQCGQHPEEVSDAMTMNCCA